MAMNVRMRARRFCAVRVPVRPYESSSLEKLDIVDQLQRIAICN